MIINNVCIFGGSGFIGRHLANLLTDQEIQLRVPPAIMSGPRKSW